MGQRELAGVAGQDVPADAQDDEEVADHHHLDAVAAEDREQDRQHQQRQQADRRPARPLAEQQQQLRHGSCSNALRRGSYAALPLAEQSLRPEQQKGDQEDEAVQVLVGGRDVDRAEALHQRQAEGRDPEDVGMRVRPGGRLHGVGRRFLEPAEADQRHGPRAEHAEQQRIERAQAA